MHGKAGRKEKTSLTHDSGNFLNTGNPVYRKFTEELLSMLYREDLGKNGDITSKMLGLRSKKVHAYIIARQDGIVSGLDEAEVILGVCRPYMDDPIKIVNMVANGIRVKRGRKLAVFGGNAADLLSVERTLLNVIGRMSGIATYAERMVKTAGKNVLVVPTRKTYWGMLDKRACFDGGAGTHRINLGDAILIKDNHLKVAGSIREILALASKNKVSGKFMEIEADDPEQIKEILKGYERMRRESKVPFYIMLDNMSPAEAKKTVNMVRKSGFYDKIFLEVSGGINLGNIKKYADTGVDVISSGSMTHSAPWFDVSMEFAA